MRIWTHSCVPLRSFRQHLSSSSIGFTAPVLRHCTATRQQRRLMASKSSTSEDQHSGKVAEQNTSSDYTTWTTTQLIARIAKLEHQLRVQNLAHANSLRIEKSITELEVRLQAESPSPPIQGLRSDTALPNSVDTSPDRSNSAKATSNGRARPRREIDATKYNTRYIALKIAYFGRKYNGFEWHANNKTPLPTVEEELWMALSKTKLIFPEGGTADGQVNWRGTEYSKCGRTDKGVSAFGQVVALRVRSARPKAKADHLVNGASSGTPLQVEQGMESAEDADFDDIQDELQYPKMLNRVLPKDIRVLAWCSTPTPDFSARFSCKERRYRYFFTQPAYAPRSGRAGLKADEDEFVRRYGWLNMNKMREAAKLFEGLHDFRNFCKIDPARQVTNYTRRIYYSAVEEFVGCSDMPEFTTRQAFSPTTCTAHQFISKSQVFTFTVHGSAFLWHQIRCMVAVLFLVGQGLEDMSVISELLDVSRNPAKPLYEMADESPLVLWDCIYPSPEGDEHIDALEWVYPDEQFSSGTAQSSSDGRYGPGGINEVLWAGWRRRKIDEVLAGSLLDVVAVQGFLEPAEATVDGRLENYSNKALPDQPSTRVFDGGDSPRIKGEYVPLLQRQRMDSSEVQNAKYAARKAFSQSKPGFPS